MAHGAVPPASHSPRRIAITFRASQSLCLCASQRSRGLGSLRVNTPGAMLGALQPLARLIGGASWSAAICSSSGRLLSADSTAPPPAGAAAAAAWSAGSRALSSDASSPPPPASEPSDEEKAASLPFSEQAKALLAGNCRAQLTTVAAGEPGPEENKVTSSVAAYLSPRGARREGQPHSEGLIGVPWTGLGSTTAARPLAASVPAPAPDCGSPPPARAARGTGGRVMPPAASEALPSGCPRLTTSLSRSCAGESCACPPTHTPSPRTPPHPTPPHTSRRGAGRAAVRCQRRQPSG